MPIQCTPVSESCSQIQVSGRFDFSMLREFRDCYRYQEGGGHLFRVDLSQAEYMDSSALGMLLLLNEHAQKLRGRVVLENPQPGIRRILEVASFGKIFEIVG